MSRHGFSSVIRFVTQNICIKPNGIAELDKSNNKVEIIDLTSRKEKEYKNKMLQTVNWNSAWRLLIAQCSYHCFHAWRTWKNMRDEKFYAFVWNKLSDSVSTAWLIRWHSQMKISVQRNSTELLCFSLFIRWFSILFFQKIELVSPSIQF